MKTSNSSFKLVLMTLLLIWVSKTQAQYFDSNRNIAYISNGYPLYNNLILADHNYILEVGRISEINNHISWELFGSRSSQNSLYGELLGTKEMAIDFIETNKYDLFQRFGKINTYGLGVKLHLSIINNEKNYFSISPGLGLFSSNSADFKFKGTVDAPHLGYDNHLIDSDPPIDKRVFGYFNNYSLQYFRISPTHNISIGAKVQLNRDRSNIPLDKQPLKSNFWAFSIVIGKEI